MLQGTVKTVTDKGFGFITIDGESKDVFYHERNLKDELAIRKLREGDRVSFEVEQTEKGSNAINIQLID